VRDIALLLLVLGVLPYAARHTWIAVLLWTWISIMNPHKLTYGFASKFPFAAIAAGAAFVSILFARGRLKWTMTPPVVALILFVVWMCITTTFAIYPDESWVFLNKTLKIQLMTLVAIAALRERKHIEWFIWINIISIGFYGVKGGIFTITTGGSSRVWGPAGGFIEGNNEIALAMIMVIPLMNYLRMVATKQWVRTLLLASLLLSVVAALGTQSRGAFLALSAMGLVLWSRSNQKFVTGAAVALVALALVSFMPASWEQRMNTIQTYDQDGSAMGRINAWWMCFKLANDRFLGGGYEIYTPAMFAKYAPFPEDLHVAHSIYFSVLGEHGWLGLFLFLLIWALTLQAARRVRRDATQVQETARVKDPNQVPETQWAFHLAGMCQVSLVGYAVGGAFLSLAYFDLPYNILVIVVVTQRWLKEERWKTETQGTFGSQAPKSKLRAAAAKRFESW
jgi:probable O-glycosylation ligase (exosortase A-associated)